ncbi:MAG TPA: acyl-CoA carboxylase subunit epsilon [Actinoplanes sp.]
MDEEPLVRVVRGTPTPEEVAALVGVLIRRSMTANATVAPSSISTWMRSARPGIGPGSWRESGLPR